MATEAAGISFDSNFRIRVLDEASFNASKQLKDECETFVSRIDELQKVADEYVQILDVQAERIEAEKLRAVGMRNRAATLDEERERRIKDLRQQIEEKQLELDKLTSEEESLLKVKQEQELYIAKITDSSVGNYD